jgi:hypothetical protein
MLFICYLKIYTRAVLLVLSLFCFIINSPSFANIYQTYTISPFVIKAEIIPDSCHSGGTGTIGLNISGGASPYSYLWNNGETTSVINNLIAGSYSVIITDGTGQSVTASIQLNNHIEWTDLTGISENTGTLTKTASDGWGNAGAVSSSILSANEDGYLEFTITSLNTDVYAIGLSEKNENNHYNAIDYAIMYNSRKIYLYENGVKVAGAAVKSNDTFKISREGSSIKYYKNNSLLRTVSANPNISLLSDVAIKNINGKIYNVAVSFCALLYEKDTAYAILKTQLDGGYHTASNGILSFIYFEEYNDADNLLNYTIYNSKREIIGSSSTHSLQVIYGENKYQINMPDDLYNQTRNYFTLEVINEKNEKWLLRFFNDVSCDNCE